MHPEQTHINTPVYNYDTIAVQQLLGAILQEHLPAVTWSWLQEHGVAANDAAVFNRAFSLVPRKTGHAGLPITDEQHRQFQALRRDLFLSSRTADQLCRI